MNICFVHEEYPKETNFGGIATYQKIIAEQLCKMGHTVSVICRGLTKDECYVENGVYIYRIFVQHESLSKQGEILYRNKVAKKLVELQRQNLIDIIETPDWGANTVYFEPYRKVPLVARLHTPLKIWLMYNRNNFGSTKELMLKWEYKMLKSCDTITSCSTILKKLVYDNYHLEERNIIVIPNPANTSDFYYDKTIKNENIILFVGSLEERKGVLVLANAMNIVLEKYPELNLVYIGKDTDRNNLNISTKEAILKNIENRFHARVKFIGQIDNEKLNTYFNQSNVAVFPSLFDNFPYVVLESMATGTQVIGSKYSGMVDMLNDNSSIYDTGNSKDLARKIIQKYEKSKVEKVNQENIDRVKFMYDSYSVCKKMLKIYENTIKQYDQKRTLLKELQKVLNVIFPREKIVRIEKEKKGVSNHVYRIYTKNKIYIIKHYLYQYDRKLANELYHIYENNNINVIRPINQKLITIGNKQYNIFEYKKEKYNPKVPISYIESLLTCNRKVNAPETITQKCNKYFQYLLTHEANQENLKANEEYVLKIYQNICNHWQFTETYLNHGDISKTNLLFSKDNYYIIDFDEITITSPLYDFAVVLIKYRNSDNKIDQDLYRLLVERMKMTYLNYCECDLKIMLQFYLCKILLEKFYLYEIGKIDLNSKRQQQDPFQTYLEILTEITEEI